MCLSNLYIYNCWMVHFRCWNCEESRNSNWKVKRCLLQTKCVRLSHLIRCLLLNLIYMNGVMEMIKTAIENVIVKNRNASSMLLYFVQSIMFMRKCDIAYHAIYIPVNYIFLTFYLWCWVFTRIYVLLNIYVFNLFQLINNAITMFL